jgi:hypothetical protein
VKQSKWVTGRWIGAVATLTTIVVFGSLAPASAVSADTTVASAVTHSASATSHSPSATSHGPSARPETFAGCLKYLTTYAYELTQLRYLYCGWAALDPNTVRGVLICTNGLVFTGVSGSVAGGACAAAITPGIRRAPNGPHPDAFNGPPGARIISPRALRPARATRITCPVDFEGSNGYQLCFTNEEYIIVDPGSGPGILQAFIVGTNGALWTAWGTTTGSLIHGWESMGGNLGGLNCAWMDGSDNAVVQGWGPQGTTYWCRYRDHATGSWGAWFACNNWSVPPDQQDNC